jgi:hypothetical protein
MPFGYCTLPKRLKSLLTLPLPLPLILPLPLPLPLILPLPLQFKSPLSAPCWRCPEREKVRRLFECSAAERV